MTLTTEQIESLKGTPLVRLSVPELGSDVVMIRAAENESLEKVLEETLEDVREQKVLAQYARKTVSQVLRDDVAG